MSRAMSLATFQQRVTSHCPLDPKLVHLFLKSSGVILSLFKVARALQAPLPVSV